MYKEIIICVVIIVVIITLNIITEKYTKNSVEVISGNLQELKNKMKDENIDNEEVKNDVYKLENDWNARYEVLAYFIEHDELEKVNTDLTSIRSNIEEKEYSEAIPEIDKCSFILEHIKDKTSMQIKNIF